MSRGVIVKKGKLGQNVLGGDDSISGILAFIDPMSSFPSSLLNKATALYNLADVASKGITSSHGVVYRDIVEFYRMAGEGTKLWLYCINTSAMGQDIEMALQSVMQLSTLQSFINLSKGEIRQLGFIAMSTNQSFGSMPVNGILGGIYNAIPLLQEFADECFEAGRPLQIILPAPNISSLSVLEHFRDDDDDIYENISIVIANDSDVMGSFVGIPLVGTLLGTIALASVNENVGKVEKFRVDNPLKSILVEPALGFSSPLSSLTEAEISTLMSKGYIFLVNYTDYPGVYWSDDPTLTKPILDEDGNMNPDGIQKGRTLNKALRIVRRHLMVTVKKNYKLSNGKLPSSMVKLLELDCEQAIDIMGNEISDRKVKINPDSNLLTGEKALEIEYIKVVPEGVVGVVKANINLTNII